MSADNDERDEYGAGQIQVLEGLEGVKERPAMYIGSTGDRGLHHLVHEVVDNAIDEALAGYCDTITVTVNPDGSVTVTDDGRGIPVQTHSEYDAPAVEVIMTQLHAGGKFDDKAYQTSGGLHGVGVSAVNGLSEWLEVTIKRNGAVWHHRFEEGHPAKDLERVREMDPDEETGTEVRFKPNADIFDAIQFDAQTLADRLRELAFLNSGVEIAFTDDRPDTDYDATTFRYEGGIKVYVEYLNETREALHDDVIYFETVDEDSKITAEIAIQVTGDVQSAVHSFANNINTHEGGSHLTGFKTAVTRAYNKYAEDNDLLSTLDGENLKGQDVRDGMTAVISIKHPDPKFEGQTKTKLENKDARSIVEQTVYERLMQVFEENPDTATTLIQKAVEAAEARKAAQKAQEVARRKSALESTSLPGKLADCQTKDPDRAELFVVEGDSAGGSAKQGRNNEFQAVLPLKGKILNVERHRLDRVLEHDEIRSLITAIGAGIGDEFDIDDIRYKNIIIATDADVDGAHIRTLLLTVFYRYMPELLENGYVYATKPPLYRIRYRGKTYDAMTETERERIIEEECGGNPSQVQRFKGLGEMNPEQLWETAMDPENRRLKRLTVEDAARADKMFSVLMGDDVGPRKEFIRENADEADWVDI